MDEIMKTRNRLMFIGASESGKTYLIYTMLMNKRFGNIKNVYVIAKNDKTLKQPLYKTLKKKLKSANVFTVVDTSNKIPPVNFAKNSLLILDDYDSFPKWAEDIYSIESHHGDMSIAALSHTYKSGNTKIRTSTNYIIFMSTPENVLLTFVNDFFGRRKDKKKIEETMRDAIRSDIIDHESGTKRFVGNVLINTTPKLDKDNNDLGLLFTIPTNYSGQITKLY